ncbi:hypothetical protein C7974DRAFT_217214 [Boeremia exigua]|uniref:uncharacterized protein n=1 Tax=Boeremia exigua TaxID=749465 RepID=UPI001E8E1C24|nr:uncharacterized protein C7974DRAFT_217214 [Boeremia exigua]KAH6622161.1 hypothetical protein C7974DRAFT_217214 [Boeremia exigua]
MSFTPLEVVADSDLQSICKCVLGWQMCGQCNGKPHCKTPKCPWSRRDRVRSVLTRYERLCSYYMPVSTAHQALSCHQDLLDIMELIKDHPNMIKEQLMKQHFNTAATSVPILDQERAFNLAVSVLLSINCGIPNDCADNLEDSADSFPWACGISVTALVDEAFGTKSNGHKTVDSPSILESNLSAQCLRSTARLRIQATDDMRSHLKLDLKARVVYLFDCTVLAEEMLAATRQSPQQGILPRKLLLEILHTMYRVLFPPGRESEAFALYLTKKHGFEKGFLSYRIRWFGRDDDPEVDYSYFGDRLVELHNELKDPSPRNWFERLFEGGTRSAERKMLMATTIGVFIAVTIGLFGLVIAGFQAWVGYQQWKHPVKDQ